MKATKNYSTAVREQFPELEQLTQLVTSRDREAFLQHLYQTDFATRFLNYGLFTCIEDQTYIPLGSERAIGIASGSENTLVLRLYHPAAANLPKSTSALHSQASDISMVLVSQTSAAIPSFAFSYDESISLSENFSKMRLSAIPDFHLRPGHAVTMRANKHVGDFRTINSALMLLAITGPALHPYTFAFEPVTLKPIQIISSKNDDTRIEYMSRVFAEMNTVEAVPQLADMMQNSSPSVRWRLARDIFKLNAKEGRSVIERLAVVDEDPHVQKAAKESLALLELHNGG